MNSAKIKKVAERTILIFRGLIALTSMIVIHRCLVIGMRPEQSNILTEITQRMPKINGDLGTLAS